MTDRDDLTRLTVNLLPVAAEALHAAVRLTELNRTDTVNRALQLYLGVVEAAAQVHGTNAIRLTADLLGDDRVYDLVVMEGVRD